MRALPPPRIVDAGVLLATVAAGVTGGWSLLVGRLTGAWIVAVHAVFGLVLAVLLAAKLWRVWPRLAGRVGRRRSLAVSVLTLAIAIGALATGVGWVHGFEFGVWRWTGLTVHAFLGLLLLPLVAWHLRSRFHPPAAADLDGRRTALQTAALVGGGVLAWRLQQAVVEVLAAQGEPRRFTGSRPAEAGDGNDFPVTSWVADDPDPIHLESWRLSVGGAVETELNLTVPELASPDVRAATLDCTSGWYVERRWSGVRVGRLLDRAGVRSEAKWVRFRSVTGYRWSLPLAEAREALLASRVDGEPLSHGHGAPLRLVAPGRRGFQWVKWVEAIDVLERPDYGQWIAIFTSGFSGRG